MEGPTLTTAPSPTKETEEKKRRRSLLPLFLLLLFLLLATSCIVGFLLGRTTEPGRFGALIDTIVLSPGETEPSPAPGEESPAAEGREERINLVGLVRYTDGTPFTQGSVRLRSEPRYSQVDGQGRFRFDRVETGEHELAVLDLEGNELARRIILVERDALENAYVEYVQEVCVLHVKLLTVEVDVEVTLDGDGQGTLTVELVGTREREPDPDHSPKDPPAVETESGSSPEPTTVPAVLPTDLPAVESPTVTVGPTPTAAPTVTPSTAPAVTPTPIPSAAPTAAPTPTPTPIPSGRPDDDDDDDDDDGGHGGGGGVTPPKPTAAPPVTGEVDVYHGNTADVWTQEAVIDLFRPLEYSDRRVIAPGDRGYYLFRLKNGRNEPISFTLALREESFHIPLKYRIAADGAVPAGLTDWQTASVDRETVSRAVPLEKNGERLYRIEWYWPFEGNDDIDTALGQRDERTYTLKLTIRVEGGG